MTREDLISKMHAKWMATDFQTIADAFTKIDLITMGTKSHKFMYYLTEPRATYNKKIEVCLSGPKEYQFMQNKGNELPYITFSIFLREGRPDRPEYHIRFNARQWALDNFANEIKQYEETNKDIFFDLDERDMIL